MSYRPPPTVALPDPLSPEERARDRERLMAGRAEDGDVWVFAYGSLIWDPCFTFDAVETAMLYGYRRAFNFWSVLSRGTPENPGLGLGLEAGGQCRGVAYRLAPETLAQDLDALWRRELLNAVYESRWLTLETPTGIRNAIGFVTNAGHKQFVGRLDDAETARIIARACGDNGPCREYLALLVDGLAKHGIIDDAMTALLARVDAESAG